jgi:DNA-binding IclR family transcriptional regulator
MTQIVTQEQLQALREAYLATESVQEAATQVGLPRTSAYYHLQQMGFDFRRTPPLKELAELAGQKKSYTELAAHFGVSRGTIHNWMVKAGLTQSGQRSRTAQV